MTKLIAERLLVISTLCFSHCATIAVAQESEAEKQDFLFQFEEAYTQSAGETQVAVIFDHSFGPRSSVLGVEVEYGLTDRLEISAELPLVLGPGEAGAGDVEFGVDYALTLEDGDMPAFTLGFGASAPSGDDEAGRGVGGWTYEASLRASKQVAPDFYVHLVGAYEWVPNGGADADALTAWTVGVGGAVRTSERLTLIAEFLREAERTEESGLVERETSPYLSAGAIFEIVEGISVGAAGAAGIGGDSADARFLVKMQIEW